MAEMGETGGESPLLNKENNEICSIDGSKRGKKGKSPNWLEIEEKVLLEECKKYDCILRAKFSNKVTQVDKDNVWKKIQQKVNANGNNRTTAQCYKKWQNCNSRSATKVRQYLKDCKKTGTYVFL